MVAAVTQRRSPWGKDPILLRRSSGQCVDKPAGGQVVWGRAGPNPRENTAQQEPHHAASPATDVVEAL